MFVRRCPRLFGSEREEQEEGEKKNEEKEKEEEEEEEEEEESEAVFRRTKDTCWTVVWLISTWRMKGGRACAAGAPSRQTSGCCCWASCSLRYSRAKATRDGST